MRKLLAQLSLVFVLTAVSFVPILALTSCSGNSSTQPPPGSTATQSGSLTIVNGSQSKILTMADLKAMPATSGLSGDMSSTGKIEGPYLYKGVALTDILKLVGGVTENNAVRVSAKDNYTMTLSYNQLTAGTGFPTFNSTTGKEVSPAGKVTVIIAYEQDTKPIDDSGPLRMALITDNLLTDGHWWEKWVIKVEVIGVEKPFSLSLEGATTLTDDKATIESCSTPGCHGETWADSQGHTWKGVPLWRFVGSVDDNIAHGTDAFNVSLADKGYEVHIRGADGFMVRLTAAEVKRNDNIIVAYQRDGASLPDNQWPLRLVGSAVSSQNMVGQITTIKVVFTSTASPSP
jgi:hypothetical protein